jgi:hypothetical protein
MTPESASLRLLGITRSKAKMYEYSIPIEDHLKIPQGEDPADLFPLALGILGDYAAALAEEGATAAAVSTSGASLQFSTRFFDAFLEARFASNLDPYLLLVGSAAYYLNDRPGSAQVLASRLGSECPDLSGRNLENLLHWLLGNSWETALANYGGRYGTVNLKIADMVRQHARSGSEIQPILGAAEELVTVAYRFGSPRELLFADLIRAVVRKRLENSSWTCLPRYSGVDLSAWRPALAKPSFTRELWPAQRLLGEKGVLSGKSAVIQFPTSAGKTHAVEMILRSAFLADRANLALVVAPFRALCHEISARLTTAFVGEQVKVDELSDVLQMDVLEEVAEALDVALTETKTILVVTPEKLLYVLRHSPEIAKYIRLLILDEGHQFDSGDRGVTYELLITALKQLLPDGVQLLLISAVIPNAAQIADWLIGKQALSVLGSNLSPTERSIAFSSWTTQRGQLHFVDSEETTRNQFFVPRVLEQIELHRRKGETKKRVFPDRNDGQSIALYLGLKLTGQGSVAIFLGRKDSAAGLADLLVDVYERGLDLPKPLQSSDPVEIERLRFLNHRHFGPDAALTKCAAWGVFLHHGNTPNGLRLAIEHAMKTGRAKFVICTSTLAQGVNLPIRYLIVTSIYQGGEKIRVRDFHNLIGRTGRSGMHTEGTILFSDPVLFDRRLGVDKWRWDMVHGLLRTDNVEPCNSSLLSLLDPLRSDDSKFQMALTVQQFVDAYIKNVDDLYKNIRAFADRHAAQKFSQDGLVRQVDWKIGLIAAIESYLMSHRSTSPNQSFPEESRQLAQHTLAYFLADPDQKTALVDVFRRLATHIESKVAEISTQQSYGKTLFGIYKAIEIEDWTKANLEGLLAAETEEILLDIVWPLIEKYLQHNLFRKCDSQGALKDLARSWIAGESFAVLFAKFAASGAKRIWGKKKRSFKLDDVVDICENAFGYEATLLVGGVNDLLDRLRKESQPSPSVIFMSLQKRLRYGLPDHTSVVVHELGFSDRVVAIEVSGKIAKGDPSRRGVLDAIRDSEDVRSVVEKYPSYFNNVYSNLAS